MTAFLPPYMRIICSGRELDDDGKATGPVCNRRYHNRCDSCDGDWCIDVGIPRHLLVEMHAVQLEQRARAAGWRLSPARDDGSHDAMCPRCARPDPELVRGLRVLT